MTKKFLKKLRLYVGCPDAVWDDFLKKQPEQTDQVQGDAIEKFDLKFVPPALQGVIERLLFTIFVAFDLSATAAAMMAWLAVKMVTYINRGDLPKHAITRQRAMTALLGGMVSMLFALVGGLLCRLKIPIL